MKVFILSCLTLFCSAALALPQGLWATSSLNKNTEYFKFEKEYFLVKEKSITQILTLGSHFYKKPYQILSIDETSANLYSPFDDTVFRISYEISGNKMTLCREHEHCKTYTPAKRHPKLEAPPEFSPSATYTSIWCVEDDCENKDLDAETLFNLNQTIGTKYLMTDYTSKKYGLSIKVLSFAYRFANDGQKMESFSSVFRLYGLDKEDNLIELNKSGLVQMKDSLDLELSGVLEGKKVTVTFHIRRTK